MFQYNKQHEIYRDLVNFGPNDPCVWVVYPPGSGGDLLASIINFHYGNTSAAFRGIDETGRVLFRSTDSKKANDWLREHPDAVFTQEFFDQITDVLSSKNTNYSLLDQFVFANHAYEQNQVDAILAQFPAAKIIRILPKNKAEQQVIEWCHAYKNKGIVAPVELKDSDMTAAPDYVDDIKRHRLVTIYLSDLLNEEKFEYAYGRILELLNLWGPMIRYDFIQYWIEKQHPNILPAINRLRAS